MPKMFATSMDNGFKQSCALGSHCRLRGTNQRKIVRESDVPRLDVAETIAATFKTLAYRTITVTSILSRPCRNRTKDNSLVDVFPGGKTVVCLRVVGRDLYVLAEGGELTLYTAQGNALRQFFYSQGDFKNSPCKGKPNCQFKIAFGNPGSGGNTYCAAKQNTTSCKNDGKEYFKPGPRKPVELWPDTKRRMARRHSQGTRFITKAGIELFIPEGANVGDKSWRLVTHNATLAAERYSNHVHDSNLGFEQFDYMSDNHHYEEDEIVALKD